MRAVSGITSSSGTHFGPERRRPHAADPSTTIESRALIPTRPRGEERRASHLPDAAFLAHLIATQDRAPQTRQLRRGALAEAAMAYAYADGRFAHAAAPKVSRKM